MRTVDADKVVEKLDERFEETLEELSKDNDCFLKGLFIFALIRGLLRQVVEDTPTVEAIPVEWINDYIDRVLYKEWFGEFESDFHLDRVRNMIQVWRNEND